MKISIARRHKHHIGHECDCEAERQALFLELKKRFRKEWEERGYP